MFAPFYEAVELFFARALHLGQPVPVVFASPDRAHTEIARIISRRTQGQGGESGDPIPRRKTPPVPTQPTLAPKPVKGKTASAETPQDTEERPVPVPFMSVWMLPPKFAPERFSPATIRGYDKDIKAGTAKNMRMPRPMNFDVQVDLWCGSAGGNHIAQQIEGQIELQFLAESVYLPIDWTQEKWYGPPFNLLSHAKELGRTRVRLVSEGWADNSDIEAGDGPKEVRRTWTGHLEAQIPYKPEEARLVREVIIDVFDNTNPAAPVLLDEITGGVED